MLGTTILAAGRSVRMGRPKLLLPWGKTSVLGHLISQWQSVGAAQITVVYASGDRGLQMELDRIGFSAEQRIANFAPERGMFSSIQSAAQWKGWNVGLTHCAIVLGDQPHLSAETLRTIIQFSANNLEHVCVPGQGGHRRHPVILPREVFLNIANSMAANLKDFLDHSPVPVATCVIDDPALELDIDHPEDYETAVRLYLRNIE